MSGTPVMIKCPKCKESIPTSTKVCPKCGLNLRIRMVINSSVIVTGLVVLLIMFFKGGQEGMVANQEECKKSAQCWGEKNHKQFFDYCGYAVEKRARFAFRWTTSDPEPQFDTFEWYDQATEKITASGTKIQFKSEDGTWRNLSYRCDFDLPGKKVLALKLQ